jgi:hypothetical protein
VVVAFSVDGGDGMRTERVVINPPVLAAGAVTDIHIVGSEQVKAVGIDWRRRFGRAPGARLTHGDLAADLAPYVQPERPTPADEAPVPAKVLSGAGDVRSEAAEGWRLRMAGLTIDRSTALPLMYDYDASAGAFSTFGYVRLGSLLLPQLRHEAPDTAAGRDEFLRAVLTALHVPPADAARIVRAAEHA